MADRSSASAPSHWTDQGYAAFSMTDRGFSGSCGNLASRTADPTGCAAGYIRLLDTRYEVRDAQLFAGMLVDEDLVDPTKIGATGGSYGGGMSMSLAALKDRVMMPDGSLIPWKSPDGTDMQIAAAAPEIPWTDLAYSLVPNGRTLDYVKDAPYGAPFGVHEALLRRRRCTPSDTRSAYYATPGTDPDADVTTWFARLNAGEPYDGDRTADDDRSTRSPSSPLVLLHRPLRGPCPAADLQRLDRRPVPARRGAALLQPHPIGVPGQPDQPLLPRLRAHARPEQGRRHRQAAAPARTNGSTTTSRATAPSPRSGSRP